MSTSDRVYPFLEAEYAQAWDHYRHTEAQRSQYLGFFFTIALGGSALVVPLLSSEHLADSQRLEALSLFLIAFQSMTYFVFVSVHRFGAVLGFYTEAMASLRAAMASALAVPEGLAHTLDVTRHRRLASMPRSFSAQRVGERILLAALITGALSATAALATVLIGFSTGNRAPAALAASAGAVVWSAVSTVIAVQALRRTLASEG